MNADSVPILRSSAVLRPEYFGGFVFNHLIPPEFRYDAIRFRIAAMCNGGHTLNEILDTIRAETMHSDTYSDQMVTQTIEQLDRQFLLYWRSQKRAGARPVTGFEGGNARAPLLSAPVAIIWELTSACNLHCRHCFSGSGKPAQDELSPNEIIHVLDQIADSKILYVNFTGGEPLLRKDFLPILEHASTKKIYFDLSTNGYLLTSDIIEKISGTHLFQFQLSLDGLEKTHDHIRGIEGAFKRTTAVIRKLVRHNFTVAVSTTVNNLNYKQLPSLIDHAIDLGAAIYKTTLFIPTGRGQDNRAQLALLPEQLKAVSNEILAKQKETDGKISILTEGFYPWLWSEDSAQEADWVRERNVGCAAGTTSLFITATGDVVPCPFLRGYSIGNLRESTLRKIWQSEQWRLFRGYDLNSLKGKCRNCEKLGAGCNGGCRAAALAYSDDILAQDPFCWKTTIVPIEPK